MQKQVIIVIVFAQYMLSAVAAQATTRYGNLIVEEGINGMEIKAECGEPVAKERYFIDKYDEIDKWVCGPDDGYLYVIYL